MLAIHMPKRSHKELSVSEKESTVQYDLGREGQHVHITFITVYQWFSTFSVSQHIKSHYRSPAAHQKTRVFLPT